VAGSFWQAVFGRQCLAGDVWRVACGVWWMAGDGWWVAYRGSNHDASRNYSLNHGLAQPLQQDLMMPHNHGLYNCSRRFCKEGRRLDLGESRSPVEVLQWNLLSMFY